MGEPVYKISEHIQVLPLDASRFAVGNPFLMQRLILSAGIAKVLELFVDQPRGLSEVRELSGAPAADVDMVIGFLLSKQLILPVDFDETAALVANVMSNLSDSPGGSMNQATRTFQAPTCIGLRELRSSWKGQQLKPLKVLLLGGCFTQFAADALEESGMRHGLDIGVTTAWPDNLALIDQVNPDLVVLQLSTTWFLAPLWDEAPLLDGAERADRLRIMKQSATLNVEKAIAHSLGRVLLLQGFSVPSLSPFGRTEFRESLGFTDIVYELNQVLASAARENPNVLFVDEERLASNVGKLRLLDTAIAPFSHHAPIDFCCGPVPQGPGRRETWGVAMAKHMPRLLAEEYLNLHDLWSGRGRIKLVVVDLDNTLWPGALGESGFTVDSPHMFQAFQFGPYGGLHQALRILKGRGILLAVSSKNNPEDVEAVWADLARLGERQGIKHLLRSSDFVVQKVNWDPKSQNIRGLMEELGVAEDAVLFIDDNPVERAEVSNALPQVRVLGESFHSLRADLLQDPGLQINMWTRENRERTATTQAQLAREVARKEAPDEASFLRSLEITLTITHVRSAAHAPRLTELIQRSTQFNTTLIRHDAARVQRFIGAERPGVYMLECRDRFTSYGVTGLCIVDEGEIDSLVVSCRVLGLQPAIPFLVSTLKAHGVFPVEGRVVEGPRNCPCRDVYDRAGFRAMGGGRFVVDREADLRAIDPSIHAVALVRE